MKWLCGFFFVALTLGLALPAHAWNLNDSEEPGSVLVFPFFERGTVATPDLPYGQATQPVTSFEISVRCPNGSTCTDQQDVDIHLEWVCGGFNAGNTCFERDFVLNTTVNGTIRFNPNGVCEPGPGFLNPEGCGVVQTPACSEGYLIGWVVDETGAAIKFDGLIGDAVLRESSTAVTAYNAITIQAADALATGAPTDVNGNGALDFDGNEYQQVTGKIIGSVLYDYLNPAGQLQDYTSLVLLTLDTLSNRPNNQVNVGLNFYNENEQVASESTQFVCFGDIRSTFFSFGLQNSTFGPKGLVESTSAVKPTFLGLPDTGPVSLLGLVLTREFDPTSFVELRHFAYPLYNDSMPKTTAFVP